jgi:DNA invertase Pin-like site-specific DNA recombinase
MAKPNQIRAVGYVRVSTDIQVQEGVSLDAQKMRIQAHCTAMDIKLVDVLVDAGASANSLDRPGIQETLKMLQQGKVDALIVMKLDRLTRSVKDLGYLCEAYFSDGKPWSLLSVSDSIDTRSASGKLILNVLTSVAQWEREAISDRTKEAM